MYTVFLEFDAPRSFRKSRCRWFPLAGVWNETPRLFMMFLMSIAGPTGVSDGRQMCVFIGSGRRTRPRNKCEICCVDVYERD